MSSSDSSGCGCDAFDVDAMQLTRRDLFGAAAGIVVTGCAGKAEKWSTSDVQTQDGVVTLDVADYPELATPGGMVALKPDGAKKPVLVMRLEKDTFRVMSLRCPHLGCVVRWDGEMQDLVCPCHGSRFTDDGQVTKGPAKQNLRQMRSQFIGMRGAAGGTKLQFVLDEG
ncbi:MAG: Rieske (2Fe-2S) protein [Myxococcota bacterium]